jgi:hypothetical protein
MRLLMSAGLLLTSITVHATELRIFEQDITLRANCSVDIRHSNGTMETKELPLKNKSKCVILPVSGTNVPRLEFVQGYYVFLVEAQTRSEKDCRGELTAVIVDNDGSVKIASKTQKTGICGYGERKDFEILFNQTIK